MLGRLPAGVTSQGWGLVQDGHCPWQKTFIVRSTKLPTEQTHQNTTRNRRASGTWSRAHHRAPRRPSETANIKRIKSIAQHPTDCVFIRKTFDQINESSDTNRSNCVTCAPKSELRVGGEETRAAHLPGRSPGHRRNSCPFPGSREEGRGSFTLD